MSKNRTASYERRNYLSANEVAKYLEITVAEIHQLVKEKQLKTKISTSGQMRFDVEDLKLLQTKKIIPSFVKSANYYSFNINNTVQSIHIADATQMNKIPDSSVHLMVTSPPYFNAKLYSSDPNVNDLGNIHDLNVWLEAIGNVWKEIYRVLQPGRKAFINIMNLPISLKNGSFRSLNLVGKTIDLCESIGFIYKRDIIWHKTNGVRAHFGSFPYPGGILINNMHEVILEFEKPALKTYRKYQHLTKDVKEESRLDKNFWLSIKNTDVWTMKPEGSSDNRIHVAQFPLELPEKLIKAYSYIGETVIDPFGGSMTTLVAAMINKRNGIAFEIDVQIALAGRNRIENFQVDMFSI